MDNHITTIYTVQKCSVTRTHRKRHLKTCRLYQVRTKNCHLFSAAAWIATHTAPANSFLAVVRQPRRQLAWFSHSNFFYGALSEGTLGNDHLQSTSLTAKLKVVCNLALATALAKTTDVNSRAEVAATLVANRTTPPLWAVHRKERRLSGLPITPCYNSDGTMTGPSGVQHQHRS